MERLRTRETKSPTWASTTSIIHLSIASSQAKGKLGKNTLVLQGTKGCRLKHKFRKQWTIIRGNLGSKMGLIRKRAKISFCELEFKNQ